MWPELIIACDVRGRGILQTDRTEGQTSQPGYILHPSPLQARTQKSLLKKKSSTVAQKVPV